MFGLARFFSPRRHRAVTTGYFTHPACLDHDMGDGHPECPERLVAIEDMLKESPALNAKLIRREAPAIDLRRVRLAHEEGYIANLHDFMQQVAASGKTRAIEPDTWVCPGSWSAAVHAAGAAVAATDAVLDGEVTNAFCAVRPPGHHATRREAMGFCFFNNVAIAARYALDVRGLKRVAVIDFDVHHGNGTEDILAGDDRVIMVGLFQHPLYPHSGTPPAASNMHNLALPARTRGIEVRAQIETHWLPVLNNFKPEMIFISAGFDAHRDDGLAELGLTEADYEWITQRLVEVARRHCQGRIVSCLEGGYNLGPLARSVEAHLQALTRD
ncbi:histone deacetylase family protein [Aquabacterium sp.]|uniref:histone deacetylase family protein n=1 Tax=Aquabacterium sp. TaxID=1872578 RepID=UPI0035B18B79